MLSGLRYGVRQVMLTAYHPGSEKWHWVKSFKPTLLVDYGDEPDPSSRLGYPLGFQVTSLCGDIMDVDEIHTTERKHDSEACKTCLRLR